MRVFQILIMVYLFSYTFSLLSKYGIEETTNGGVVFDSNDFDDGDKMYFKIDFKRSDFNYNDIVVIQKLIIILKVLTNILQNILRLKKRNHNMEFLQQEDIYI